MFLVRSGHDARHGEWTHPGALDAESPGARERVRWVMVVGFSAVTLSFVPEQKAPSRMS